MSHIKEQKLLHKKNEVKCMHWLRCSRFDYMNIQHQYGLRYLREAMQLDEWNARLMEEQPTFWKWWINEWNLRNEREFLPQVEQYTKRRALYLTIHNPMRFNRAPSDVVLSESYAAMISKLNNEIKTTPTCLHR